MQINRSGGGGGGVQGLSHREQILSAFIGCAFLNYIFSCKWNIPATKNNIFIKNYHFIPKETPPVWWKSKSFIKSNDDNSTGWEHISKQQFP